MPSPVQNTTGIVIYPVDNPADQFGDFLVFDATMRSSTGYAADITSSPVEGGEDVVDHRRRRPAAYTFTGILLSYDHDPSLAMRRAFYEYPTEYPAAIELSATRALDMYQSLVSFHKDNRLLDIVTEFETLKNVMIESLDATPISHGDGVEVNCTVREVQFASVEFGPVPEPAARTSRKKKDKGDQSGASQDPADDKWRDVFTFGWDEL